MVRKKMEGLDEVLESLEEDHLIVLSYSSSEKNKKESKNDKLE